MDVIQNAVEPVLGPVSAQLTTLTGISISPVVLLTVLGTVVIASVVMTCLKPAYSYAGQRSTKKRGDTLMLLGNCDVGKTALLGRLKSNSFISTVTSQALNKDSFQLASGTSVKVIDFPGHHRLREGLKKHLPQTSAIVFVLDANAKTSAFISDADYLYNLFTSEFVNDTNIPFIIVCNKSDMLTARTKDDIKPILEKELNQIRTSQLSMPGQEAQNRIYLGIEGENFVMDHLPFPVSFAEVSVKEGSGVSEVLEFIQNSKNL